MSDNNSGESMVLNWRGPLLAAAIFAVVFSVLLLMAHQNQANTSDMGSSLRQDPYGTSLLFDSYQRAGYQVERSQDQDALSDQNASRTTAFFIGGYPSGDWEMENGKLRRGPQFLGRLENFLARGGRVVLVEPAWDLKSESQGWEVENKWSPAPHESGPAWVSPDLGAVPAGSEVMYLAAEAPWLKTDAHWTMLYAAPVDADANADSSAHVYLAMRRVEKGELVAASQESFLLNEAIKMHPNPVLLDFLAGGRPVIWVDETLHGLHQDQGALWLVQRYRLQAALLFFWATLLTLLWSLSGDLVRRPPRHWSAEVVRNGESAGVAGQRLLQRSISAERVVAECWEQFERRSPQDAKAIRTDPRWGPRLRAALAQPPLPGYKELTELICERRATAQGLAHLAQADGGRPDSVSASPRTTSEEARTA
jgi:Domain of unknown function (DUF4350)